MVFWKTVSERACNCRHCDDTCLQIQMCHCWHEPCYFNFMKDDFSSKLPPKTKERSPRRPKPRLWLLITTDESEQPKEKAPDVDPDQVPTLAKMLPKAFRDSSLSSSLDQDLANDLQGMATRERDPFEADCHHTLVNRESERKPGNKRSVVRRVSTASTKISTDERLIVPVNSLYLNNIDPSRSSVPNYPNSPDFTLCSPKRGTSFFLCTPGAACEVSYCNLSMIEAAQPSPESNRTDYEIPKAVLSPAQKSHDVLNTDGHHLPPPDPDNRNSQGSTLTSDETNAVRILQQVMRSYLARHRMKSTPSYQSNESAGYLLPELVENPKAPANETQNQHTVLHLFSRCNPHSHN
jgi:hypothetical protein